MIPDALNDLRAITQSRGDPILTDIYLRLERNMGELSRTAYTLKNEGGLSGLERSTIEALGKLYNDFTQIVAIGPSREGDMAEIAFHVHALQRMIGAQAAARLYPNEFRKLGSTVTR